MLFHQYVKISESEAKQASHEKYGGSCIEDSESGTAAPGEDVAIHKDPKKTLSGMQCKAHP
jgi:hypothetical protein